MAILGLVVRDGEMGDVKLCRSGRLMGNLVGFLWVIRYGRLFL